MKKQKIEQAVILAAGEGSRLRPYTDIIPKAMFPVNGKPIIHCIIQHISKYGITDIVICTNKKFQKIISSYLGSGERFGVKVSYSISPKPLGTVGEIINCKNKLKDSFLLYYGDQITSINLKSMMNLHFKKNADVTLALTKVKSDYGLVHIDRENFVKMFEEKPFLPNPIWTGIAIIKKSLLKNNKSKDFGSEFFPRLLKEKNVVGYISKSFWNDIGSISQFIKINERFSTK